MHQEILYVMIWYISGTQLAEISNFFKSCVSYITLIFYLIGRNTILLITDTEYKRFKPCQQDNGYLKIGLDVTIIFNSVNNFTNMWIVGVSIRNKNAFCNSDCQVFLPYRILPNSISYFSSNPCNFFHKNYGDGKFLSTFDIFTRECLYMHKSWSNICTRIEKIRI